MANIANPGHGHVSLEPMNLSPRFDEVAGQGDSPLWRRRAHAQPSRPSLAANSGLIVGSGVNTPPPRRSRSLWQQLTPEDPPSDPASDSSPSAKTGTALPSRSSSEGAIDALDAPRPLSAAASRNGRSSAAPGGRKRTPLPRPKENMSAPAGVGGSTGRKRAPPLGGRGASAGGKRSRHDEVLASAKNPATISASNVRAVPKRRSSTITEEDEDVEVIFGSSSASIAKAAAKKRVAFSSDDEGEVKPPTSKPTTTAKAVLRAVAKQPPKTNVADARAKVPSKAVAVGGGPIAVGGGLKKRPAAALVPSPAAAQACNAKASGSGSRGRGRGAGVGRK